MSAVAFRREIYLAVVITCLQRFESHILKFLAVHLCFVDKFCDKTTIILWEKIWNKHYLKIKSALEETSKSTGAFLEKSLLNLWTSKNFF